MFPSCADITYSLSLFQYKYLGVLFTCSYLGKRPCSLGSSLWYATLPTAITPVPPSALMRWSWQVLKSEASAKLSKVELINLYFITSWTSRITISILWHSWDYTRVVCNLSALPSPHPPPPNQQNFKRRKFFLHLLCYWVLLCSSS